MGFGAAIDALAKGWWCEDCLRRARTVALNGAKVGIGGSLNGSMQHTR